MMEHHSQNHFIRNSAWRKCGLWIYDPLRTSGVFQLPVLEPCRKIPAGLIHFHEVLSRTGNKENWIDFWIDDYQFERLWNAPDRYLNLMRRYPGTLSPDWSICLDMPLPVQLWNCYRSRVIARWLQDQGIYVIPSIVWAGADSWQFCFDGLPKHSTVAISTQGQLADKDLFKVFQAGALEMLRRLEPETVLVYGDPGRLQLPGAKTVHYANIRIAELRKYH